MILLIDVDGTLTNEVCYTPEECEKATPKMDAIDKVNERFRNDFIIIYTARRNDLYIATIDWLNKYGVKYHAVKFEKTPGVIFDLDAINKIKEL
jgi:uncharacterized HAD superfamily protein